MRYTQKILEILVVDLNEALDLPTEAWSKDETTGKFTANIGTYTIGAQYGYYSIESIINDGGGVTKMFSGSARECCMYVRGMIAGIYADRQKNEKK